VGSWQLDLELPQPVDPQRAHATLRYGVLVVMAPLSPTGSGESRPTIE
jgi:HSP20 family molecular chaperone IbpA